MTEEEARDAIVKAAVAWEASTMPKECLEAGDVLLAAIKDYRKAAAPPEPIELFVGRYHGRPLDGGGYPRVDTLSTAWDEVWRCTVTPIERVR